MAGHDPRCEASTGPRSACRCSCGGAQHGTAATATQDAPAGQTTAADGDGAPAAQAPAAQEVAEASLGVTPFRGPPRDTAAAREAYRQTSRWRNYQRALVDEARTCGVTIVDRQAAEGLWEGAAEPAEAVTVRGSREAITALAARMAGRFNQDAVMVVTPDRAATGRLYHFPDELDTDRALALLRAAGIPGGRVVGGRLEVADPDDSMVRDIQALSAVLGSRPVAVRARVDFVAKDDEPTGWQVRQAASPATAATIASAQPWPWRDAESAQPAAAAAAVTPPRWPWQRQTGQV